jgi:hypothetical protein
MILEKVKEMKYLLGLPCILAVSILFIASQSNGSGGEVSTDSVPVDAAEASGWVRTWGGSGTDGVLDVVTGSDGSIYTAGYFWGTSNFNPRGRIGDNRTAHGRFDAFIAKHVPSGALAWVWNFGGESDDRVEFLAVCGTDLYASCRIGAEYSLLKFSTVDGVPAPGWASPVTAEMIPPCGLAADTTGVYWLCATGPPTGHQFSPWVLAKYSPDGDALWSIDSPPGMVRVVGAQDVLLWTVTPYNGNGIAVTDSEVWVLGNKIMSRYEWNICCISYDKSSGEQAGPVVSFGSKDKGTGGAILEEPTQIDEHPAGSFCLESPPDIAMVTGCGILASDSGDLIISGRIKGDEIYLASSGDTPHGSLVNDRWDYFVTRLSRDGALRPGWPLIITASQPGCKYKDLIFDMALDGSGNVYIGGCFTSLNQRPLGGGPVLQNTNRETCNSDAFIARIDATPDPPGSWSWSRSWGTSLSFDIVRGVAVSGSFVYAAGLYANDVDFSPSESWDGLMNGYGEEDAFLVRHRLSDGLW